ncbi:MAG: mshA 1 [Gammaproteobacteria bacterium]|jgi:glycosyltransferase involved in cell wall biosynthesis|nr:mshA 1 [Gammaproteobacteria bacterium]
MKFGFATTFDSNDVSNWSGTPFYMANAFSEQGIDVERIGRLKRQLPPYFKLKQFWKKITCGQRESPRFNTFVAKHYSQQIAKRLEKLDVDAIIAPLINPIAYLDSQKPIVLWTDALYAGLLGFYTNFSNHSVNSIQQGNIITQECLSRCKFAIFSSDWAARTALEIYGIAKEKVKVVPFGANIQCHHTVEQIRQIIKSRSKNILKLLFIGKHWERKGGDIVFNVTQALHKAGQAVELNFIGCYPPENREIPGYIKCHGFISKRTPEGIEKITRLLHESHFLFVPSRAECFGIVFAEANAFGLPCLSSYVGGISSVIKDNMNGMTFGLDAPVDHYCEYLTNLMSHYATYEQLALSAFNEYSTRLNWKSATNSVIELIKPL